MLRERGRIHALAGGYLLDDKWNLKSFSLSPSNTKGVTRNLEWRARLKRMVTPRKRRWKEAIWPVNRSHKGIYGWLVSALPRLYLLEERKVDIPVLLPALYRDTPRIAEALNAFDNLNFEFLASDTVGVIENLWTMDEVSRDGELLSRTANLLRNRLSVSAAGGKHMIT